MLTKVVEVDAADLLTARLLVVNAIRGDKLEWRHHGAGMIQAYLTPCLRLHIWHPFLQLPEMEHMGAIHDHRFDLLSTVLLGSLTNREFSFDGDLYSGTYHCFTDKYETYRVECASSGKRDDPTKTPNEPRLIYYKDMLINEGSRYTYPMKHFHESRPAKDFVVTLVHKLNQEKFLARLLVPEGMHPVHAFEQASDSKHHTLVPADDAERARIFYNRHLTLDRMKDLARVACDKLQDKADKMAG